MGTKKLKLKKEDYILYILNKLEPKKSGKLILNKIAFFVEFAFLQKYNQDLSTAEYAAIPHGPVIDGYDEILKSMEKNKLVKIDGYIVRPLHSPKIDISNEQREFIDRTIERYSNFSSTELRGLSHQTDSYKITTDNERVMGKKINKKLAMLETFLMEDEVDEVVSENELPKVDRSELIPYVR
ncbi:MAG: Panacea domain-containing protein [Patescibacteria group bacterium]